jgi:hypothetical protein
MALVTEFVTPGCYPQAAIQAYGIAAGPDGNLWITVNAGGVSSRASRREPQLALTPLRSTAADGDWDEAGKGVARAALSYSQLCGANPRR